MIRLKADAKRDTFPTITIFPDKTSQVWKIPDAVMERGTWEIRWVWEANDQSEKEIFHLMQLLHLAEVSRKSVKLVVPYFPFARQDKDIDNSQTFAGRTLVRLLVSFKCLHEVVTEDIHNPDLIPRHLLTNQIDNETREYYINQFAPDVILFPDKGAEMRYAPSIQNRRCVSATKVRDPQTGVITRIDVPDEVQGKRVMIIDDICDGGATFISLAKLMPTSVICLYVTHGIFSKGKKVLKDAGISEIISLYDIGEQALYCSLIRAQK